MNNLTKKQTPDLEKYCTNLINKAREEGVTKIFSRAGAEFFLETKENLIKQQAVRQSEQKILEPQVQAGVKMAYTAWIENDQFVNFDFSTSNFWLTTDDDGADPEAVDSAQDLVDLFLEKNWSDRGLDNDDVVKKFYSKFNDEVKEFYRKYNPEEHLGWPEVNHDRGQKYIYKECKGGEPGDCIIENDVVYYVIEKTRYIDCDDETVYRYKYEKSKHQQKLNDLLNEIRKYEKPHPRKIATPQITYFLNFERNPDKAVEEIGSSQLVHIFYPDFAVYRTKHGVLYIKYKNNFYELFLADIAKENGIFSYEWALVEAIDDDKSYRKFLSAKKEFNKIIGSEIRAAGTDL